MLRWFGPPLWKRVLLLSSCFCLWPILFGAEPDASILFFSRFSLNLSTDVFPFCLILVSPASVDMLRCAISHGQFGEGRPRKREHQRAKTSVSQLKRAIILRGTSARRARIGAAVLNSKVSIEVASASAGTLWGCRRELWRRCVDVSVPQVVEEILGVISTTTVTRPEKEHIPVFTMEEIQTSIGCFKRKKAGDKTGIRAEGLKERDDETKTKMKDISNEIKQENTVPDSWKKVIVKRSSRR